MGPTEAKVVKYVAAHPGTSISAICRGLNGRHVRECYKCPDYANPDRRKRILVKTVDCRPRLATVKKVVWRLRKRRVFRGVKKKVADARMARGWDYITAIYPGWT